MKLKGLLVVSAALGMMAAAPTMAVADNHEGGAVKCQGANACAGKGECSAADGSHDCGGKNSCKGKGWIKTASAEECKEKGGTVVE